MEREEAEAVALAGGEPARELVVALLGEVEKIGALQEQIVEMAERIAELERQVNRDSSNSSMPPSQDPPRSRAERRQAAREAYKRSMRQSGGQPGHEGKTREMAAPERVDERFEHLPGRCECGHCFSGSEERLGDPLIHQKWELPPISPLVFEHRPHRLACPRCGKANLAELRRAGISPSGLRAADGGPHRRPRRRLPALASAGRRGRARGLRL